MNRTPWFPGDIKPAHVGVYERQYNQAIGFTLWDGKAWKVGGASTPDGADTPHAGESTFQELPWRGIAREIA